MNRGKEWEVVGWGWWRGEGVSSAGINGWPTGHFQIILLKWPSNIVRDRSFDRLFIALSYSDASAYLFPPPIRIPNFSSHTGVLMTSTHATRLGPISACMYNCTLYKSG